MEDINKEKNLQNDINDEENSNHSSFLLNFDSDSN